MNIIIIIEERPKSGDVLLAVIVIRGTSDGKVICGRDSLPEMTEIVSDIEQEFIDGKSINSLKWKHFNTFHNLFGQR